MGSRGPGKKHLPGAVAKGIARPAGEVFENADEVVDDVAKKVDLPKTSVRPNAAKMDPSMRHARPQEQRTAARLTDDPRFDGRTFHGEPPPDPGHDWHDDQGRTYDALGDGTKSQYFRLDQFTRSIDSHLLKSNDFTVIDMTGYTPDQIRDVTAHLDSLPADKLAKVVRVGF